MSSSGKTHRLATILRWIARIWSLGMLVVAIMMFVSPDPNATGPIAVGDAVVLGFWGISVIGLLLGWRWEATGAIIAIAGAVANYVGFRFVHGAWPPGPLFIIIPLIVFVLPAVLYLLAQYYDSPGDTSIGA